MLKTILSISGKPGLYKLISQGKNMLIVESINAEKNVSLLMVMKNYLFGRYSNVHGRCRSSFV